MRTVVYDIETAQITEETTEYFSKIVPLSFVMRDASQTLVLTLNGETRELTMKRLLAEHHLMQTAEQILKKSLYDPIFGAVFLVDENIYFSCAIYDKHGGTTSLLFFYDWAEDEFYYIHHAYLFGGGLPDFKYYVPIPIIE